MINAVKRWFSGRDAAKKKNLGVMGRDSAAWLRGDAVTQGRVTNAYLQSVWVYRAVNALAEQVANVPFRFSEAGHGTKDRIFGPLEEFYRRPHPQLNGFQYWELRVIWLMLRGECVRLPMFSEGPHGRKKLDRVVLLDPAHFRHIVEDGRLEGWVYRPDAGGGAAEQVFLPEEVWFERLPNPFDFYRGVAPLTVAYGAVCGDYAASQFMRGLMENNGDAGVIVKTEEMLEPDHREALLQALRERKRGCGTADRPLLLWGGAEVVAPTISSADMQLLEHRKFGIEEICAAFGVPVEIMTTISAAKYDVMKGTRLNFVENRVIPLCRRLEAEEQRLVKLLDPRAVGWFDVEDIPAMAESRGERLKAAQVGFQMGVPLNELNRTLGLGFKALPWGDAGYVDGKMIKVGGGK